MVSKVAFVLVVAVIQLSQANYKWSGQPRKSLTLNQNDVHNDARDSITYDKATDIGSSKATKLANKYRKKQADLLNTDDTKLAQNADGCGGLQYSNSKSNAKKYSDDQGDFDFQTSDDAWKKGSVNAKEARERDLNKKNRYLNSEQGYGHQDYEPYYPTHYPKQYTGYYPKQYPRYHKWY